jgi:general secretion pathway protein D
MIEIKMKRSVVLLLLTILLCGCAGQRAYMAGQDLMQQGKYDEAVAEYFQAAGKEPENKEYRMRLLEARAMAAQEHLKNGRLLALNEDYRAAATEFEQATALDPSVEVALNELKVARNRLRAMDLMAEAEQFYQARKFTQAKAAANEALQLRPGYEPPQALLDKIQGERKLMLDGVELDVTSAKPITLKFKDADVRDVFNILSRLSGINFIFDDEIRSQRVSVLLEDASFAQALELLLNMNKLGKKVLNPKTIIIYPKTKDKEKQYEDQLIQTFYLSNIDAKKAVNLLRTMLQLRKIYVHEELNALVIRDTPEVVKLAKQIIEAADLGDSEVLFDVELIEVNHTTDLNIGPKLGTYSVSVGMSNPGSDRIVADSLISSGPATNLVSGLSRLDTFYTLPTATFDFLKRRSDAEVLANPKIRVKNKEKAKVLVGTREPIITVTQTNDTVTDNVQYVDVGVKLDVEPTIQLDDSVITKISLEVSSVSGRQTTESGTQVLTITTTNAQTGLTLKDGERTIIGGLIRDDSTNSSNTIAFIGDIPIIGPLLTSYTRNKTKREILLSITPHIVRNIEMPRADVAAIWSGGEEDLKAGQTFGAFAVPVEKEAPRPMAPGGPAIPAPSPFPPAVPESGTPEPWPPLQVPPTAPGEAPPAAFPPGMPAAPGVRGSYVRSRFPADSADSAVRNGGADGCGSPGNSLRGKQGLAFRSSACSTGRGVYCGCPGRGGAKSLQRTAVR